MWGVGLTMCIIGLLAILGKNTFRGDCFCFAFIVAGLVAMWAAP